ncbi:hypothetical protein B0H14DRAFT_2751372 [Mycena olivaceomarginata]|nr:hypothetical protein B0H14DRAFT_2751372 [Mycena olivaceomarginata]
MEATVGTALVGRDANFSAPCSLRQRPATARKRPALPVCAQGHSLCAPGRSPLAIARRPRPLTRAFSEGTSPPRERCGGALTSRSQLRACARQAGRPCHRPVVPVLCVATERMGGTVLISGELACAARRLTSTAAGVKACGAFFLPGVEKTGRQLAFLWRDRACATVSLRL